MDRTSPLYLQRFFPCKEVLIAMLPLVFMSVVMYGIRPALLILFSMACSYALDYFMHRARQLKFEKYDFSSLVSGAVLVMLLPASVPFWVVLVGDIVSILLVKHAFGGYGNNIFNPAAVGVALLSLMWPSAVLSYPTPMVKLPIFMAADAELIASPLATLKAGGVPYLQKSEMLTGNFAGPIGASGALILVAIAVYLIVRKVIDWRLPASFLATVSLMSFFFPRIHATRLDSMLYELFCSGIIFCALFVVAEPVTAPKRALSKYIYGCLFGLVTVLFRYYGAFEIGVPFAAIAVNAISSFIDRRIHDYEGRYTLSKQITGDNVQ